MILFANITFSDLNFSLSHPQRLLLNLHQNDTDANRAAFNPNLLNDAELSASKSSEDSVGNVMDCTHKQCEAAAVNPDQKGIQMRT